MGINICALLAEWSGYFPQLKHKINIKVGLGDTVAHGKNLKKMRALSLKQIHFHTLRHWRATIEYNRTKCMLHVKALLGHKQLRNTEIYAHLIDFESDD